MTKAASAVAGSERRSYFRNLTPLRATPTYAAVVLLRRPGGHADRPWQARSKFARAFVCIADFRSFSGSKIASPLLGLNLEFESDCAVACRSVADEKRRS